jgi:hypothetical protein
MRDNILRQERVLMTKWQCSILLGVCNNENNINPDYDVGGRDYPFRLHAQGKAK